MYHIHILYITYILLCITGEIIEEGVGNSLRADKYYLGYKGKPDDRSLAETCSTYFGAFANLRKIIVNFVMSVHPSASLSVRISVPLFA
jgi:hypothetical protein